jgi:hypothetical protein
MLSDRSMKFVTRFASLFAVALALAATGHAQSLVAVSTCYNDEPANGSAYSVGSNQPVPWIGSPNTTFYGNAGVAATYDPDEDGILLQNMGTSAIDLTAASIGSYDLFTLDSITGPVELDVGANVILAGVDGSDLFSGIQSVDLTIGGIGYNYSDVATAEAPSGVLDGANPWVGGAESQPWTSITSIPEPSAYALLVALSTLGFVAWRKKSLQVQGC